MNECVTNNRDAAELTVRKAARALARAGLVGAYGHCSVRLSDTELLVCASKPMGTILPGERGTVVPIEGELPEGVLGEVKVHQQVYRRRKDVGAVCRVFPPNVMTMSVLNKRPVSRHGLSAFFFPQPAFWNDVSLMRTDALAASVADAIGLTPGIMLRGNGAIVAGSNMAQCLSLCMYLEEMCRVELGVLASGTEADPIPLDSTEARNRSDWNGRVEQRMWDHLTFKDPE